MTSKQRAYLMSLASNLNPIFQVGKSSLTPELTAAIGESFNNNELIKIGVLKNCFDDPRADPVLRTGHELSEKGEPRETDRHVRDLGTADPDAALYAAVSGSGLLFLDLP